MQTCSDSGIVYSYFCRYSHCVCGNCVGSLFCNVILVPFLVFTTILLSNRERVTLLKLCYCCFVAVSILCLFLKVPGVVCDL